MKNKILSAGILALALFFAGTIYAVGQGNNATTTTANQAQQQTQVENQGEANQIQTQEQGEDNENDTEDEIEDGVEAQDQQGLENGNENRNQNQERNQEQETTKRENGSSTSEQRRSSVANAVQKLLQVANRSGGIGQQVRTIAQEQNQNQEKLEANLQKIEGKSTFMKFLFGPDYNEINSAQKLLDQRKEQIQQLNQIKSQILNKSDAQSLAQQIQTLEQANTDTENSLETAQNKFSLFGWMFRLFSK